MDPPADPMDIDESADLEFVADDFEEGEHEKMDKSMLAIFPQVTPVIAPVVLAMIVQQSGDRLLKKYRSFIECETLLDNYPSIKNLILEDPENGYRKLRLLKLLRPEPVSRVQGAEALPPPPVWSWESPYVGGAANALWDHIVKWFMQTGPGGRRLYARYCAIVQSSGMGKSRLVDELSKVQFVIPVNLRVRESSGYPPPDNFVRDYLSGSMRQEEAFIRSCAFLHALFLQTIDVVRPMAKETIAEQFRNNMKEGMLRDRHGEWRESFYEAVVRQAGLLHDTYLAYFREGPRTKDQKLMSSSFPLRVVFEALYGVHENQLAADQQRAKPRDPHSIPYVILAFDEAHCLTELTYEKDHEWSQFGELRRAIRGLLKEPLFTVFLSTSGAMFSVTPTPTRDISGRMVTTCDVIPPFFDLGFDQLALRVDFSRKVILSEVASLEHLASYGRPLWRPYLKDQEAYLVDFAIMKLLGGVRLGSEPLVPQQKLACLAERIPIEFLSTTFASQFSEQEKYQVHAHMRVILKIDDNLETIVTIAPSEPVLSEAAYSIMTTEGFNPPQALQEILNGFAVHKGELGELIVALLFTMARDKAVGSGLPEKEQRWCSVTGLLESLFCTTTRVTAHGGSEFTPNGTRRLRTHLGTTFKGSSVYFTHFIKVHQHAVVELKFLMHLMVRGAAILCTNDQPGIDGIIPFLLEGDEIREGNIGVIMFRVRNDDYYKDSPDQALVLEMDPLLLRLTNPDIPIIRFFFALAASNPTLQRVTYEKTYQSKFRYKAYDFWVSGLSSTIFDPVVDNDVAWGSLLKVSQGWEQIYSGASGHGGKLRKSMNPGAATAEEFWQDWCEEVPHY